MKRNTKPKITQVNLALMTHIICPLGPSSVSRMDVENDFLNGDMFEEVCMQWPQGFPIKEKEHTFSMLVKLHYGLKQAPKAWHL